MERTKKECFTACFIDFFAILAANFILISLLLVKNVADEYLTKVNLYERKMAGSLSEQGVDIPALAVLMERDGSQSFVLESKTIGTLSFDNTSEVKAALGIYKPARIKLRLDKRVPSGILQELLLDAKELEIHAEISVKKKR